MTRRFLETAHLLALGSWFGAILMSGAMAAVLFPMMRDLDPAIPAFAGYPSDHWVIAAGKPANFGFVMLDVLGSTACVIAVATLAALALWKLVDTSRVSTVLRLIALAAAGVTLIYSAGVLRPRMHQDLSAFWRAAEAGDVQLADAHREAFDKEHPKASLWLTVQLVTVGWAFGAGCFSACTPTTQRPRQEGTS